MATVFEGKTALFVTFFERKIHNAFLNLSKVNEPSLPWGACGSFPACKHPSKNLTKAPLIFALTLKYPFTACKPRPALDNQETGGAQMIVFGKIIIQPPVPMPTLFRMP
ncbi:MAG: hypothetical protein GY862_12520 [Gammaproteobacteria bacterium]|nr:hypothetical protein [Gammaproteobacteria bacterium]